MRIDAKPQPFLAGSLVIKGALQGLGDSGQYRWISTAILGGEFPQSKRVVLCQFPSPFSYPAVPCWSCITHSRVQYKHSTAIHLKKHVWSNFLLTCVFRVWLAAPRLTRLHWYIYPLIKRTLQKRRVLAYLSKCLRVVSATLVLPLYVWSKRCKSTDPRARHWCGCWSTSCCHTYWLLNIYDSQWFKISPNSYA